jgi:hypothetical protein
LNYAHATPGPDSRARGLALARDYERLREAERDPAAPEGLRCDALDARRKFEKWLKLYGFVRDADSGWSYAWSQMEQTLMRYPAAGVADCRRHTSYIRPSRAKGVFP